MFTVLETRSCRQLSPIGSRSTSVLNAKSIARDAHMPFLPFLPPSPATGARAALGAVLLLTRLGREIAPAAGARPNFSPGAYDVGKLRPGGVQ